jgi:Zn finger protein HypA/HybF involved in hydrogenase expression
VITLGRRLEALERSVGGACPKCTGIMVTLVAGELRTITRHGQPLGAVEERAEFESTRPRCPECGAGFLEIRVPSEQRGNARPADVAPPPGA